jgi:hypothetical protein
MLTVSKSRFVASGRTVMLEPEAEDIDEFDGTLLMVSGHNRVPSKHRTHAE